MLWRGVTGVFVASRGWCAGGGSADGPWGHAHRECLAISPTPTCRSRHTRYLEEAANRTDGTVRTVAELVGLRSSGPPPSHLPRLTMVRGGETLRLIAEVSALVRFLALECAAFLDAAATTAFDVGGWLLLPPGVAPLSPEVATLTELQREETRHRAFIQGGCDHVARLTSAVGCTRSRLLYRQRSFRMLQSGMTLYEGCSVEKTFLWADAIVLRVQTLLLHVLDGPDPSRNAPGRRQLHRLVPTNRAGLSTCRCWFEAVAQWCAALAVEA